LNLFSLFFYFPKMDSPAKHIEIKLHRTREPLALGLPGIQGWSTEKGVPASVDTMADVVPKSRVQLSISCK